jgi:hypothetical protein
VRKLSISPESLTTSKDGKEVTPLVGKVEEGPADQKREESPEQPKDENIFDIFEEDALMQRIPLREDHRREEDVEDDHLIDFGLGDPKRTILW